MAQYQELGNCSLGEHSGTECHKSSYTQLVNLLKFEELSASERQMIELRSGINSGLLLSICEHHKTYLLKKYKTYQITCYDPFRCHRKKISKSLRTVTPAFSFKINSIPEIVKAIPGQKICNSCREKVDKYTHHNEDNCGIEELIPIAGSDDSIGDLDEDSLKEKALEEINSSFKDIGMSPLKLHAVASHSKSMYTKRKLKVATSTLNKKVCKVLDKDFIPEHDSEVLDKASDMDVLVGLLKEKLVTAGSRREIIQLLTLAPTSWSRKKVATEFNVSEYAIRQARELLRVKGIIAIPDPRRGKNIEQTTVDLVHSFYQNDEYSRLMPGMKDKEAGLKMLPGQSVCGSVQPQLPKPRLMHQPMDPIFTRPRQFMHDFPPPLVSQILTHGSNLVSCKDTNLIEPRSLLNGNLSTGLRNLPKELPLKSNPHSFMPLNQEAKNQPSKSLDLPPEHVKLSESRMSMGSGANNFQTNGPGGNARMPGEGMTPATDPYSFYNRLCELFPDIHPPQLQRVFDECGRDFLRTIDNVLYARRLRKSILAQMAKFRAQQRNQPNSTAPNPQQQQDQEASNHSQGQGSQQQKPEKQPQLSPKSCTTSKGAANARPKRSRILAYQPASTSGVNSSRRGGITSPKSNQASQGPGTSVQQSMRKSSEAPAPNVFVQKIDMGLPTAGSGDASVSRKTNQGYIFSFKRPGTVACGSTPHQSPHLTIPISSCDFSPLRPPLPPPPSLPFCSPQQFSLTDWCPKDTLQFEPHVSLSTPQQQMGQNPQQDISDDRIGLNLQSVDPDHLPGERNLDAPQPSSDPEPPEWTLLLKTIMDPIQAVDSSSASGMINTQQMGPDDIYTVNQKKQTNGNFFFKVGGSPGFTFVSDSVRKSTEENCGEAQVGETKNTHQGVKLSSDSMQESLSDGTDLNRNDESRMGSSSEDRQMNTTPSGIMNGARKSLVLQYDNNEMEQVEKSDDETLCIQLNDDNHEKQEAKGAEFSPENQIAMDTDAWIQSDVHEEQVNDSALDSPIVNDGYSHILGI